MSPSKQEITDAFERHFNANGYDKTTLDDVARELHISKKTIYVHFDGKQDIYASVVRRNAALEKAKLAASVAGLPTLTARLEALMRYVVDAGRAHIAETGTEEWMREYAIAADVFAQAHGDLLRELVQQGMDAGEFRLGDARLVEKMVAAMLKEYLVGVNADPAYNRDDELIERIHRFIT